MTGIAVLTPRAIVNDTAQEVFMVQARYVGQETTDWVGIQEFPDRFAALNWMLSRKPMVPQEYRVVKVSLSLDVTDSKGVDRLLLRS